ncbi:MAG TPA: hypothetical protein VH082_09050 [Rudaea sp.]|jgi:hypothetical protein|nr:hypothetical protein [Rudaea sp.]
MSALFQRLVNGFPERHMPAKTSFATDAKSLRLWISQLPLANPTAVSRLLISALREMNQLRIEAVQRLEALELLRPQVATVVANLSKQVIGDSFPLPPTKHANGQLAQDFEQELAIGYSAAAYDLCAPAGAVPFLRAKYVSQAVTRAIQHRGALLFQAYLRYQAPPPGVWQNLHDLFRFAVAVSVDDRAVIDPTQQQPPSNVRQAYIHALLVALTNPYRFTQRENSEIYELTRIWSALCELREGRAPDGAIAVRTDDDASPGYLPEERETPGEGLWALEVNGLVRSLEGQLAGLPPGVAKTQFRTRGGPVVHAEIAFVERLLRSWRNGAERGQQRIAAGHSLDTVIGLHDLHYVLAGDTDFDAFLRKTRGVAITLHERDRAASWAVGGGGAPVRVKHLTAKVLDQSLSGYRLMWEKIEGMRVRVGELVGLASPAEDGESQDWMIGAIRWMRLENNGALDAGIQLLARRATPAALRAFDDSGDAKAAMRGIVLEDLNGQEHAETISIMAPQLFDRHADNIELTRPGDPFAWQAEPTVETVRVVDALDVSGGYLRLDIVNAAARDASSDQPPRAANDDPHHSELDSASAQI